MPRALRDTLTFLLGAGILAHEVAVVDGQRPYLILAGMTLAFGIPIGLRIDEARRKAAELLDPAKVDPDDPLDLEAGSAGK